MRAETKYNVGDIVWYIYNNKVRSRKITGVGITVNDNIITVTYTLQGDDKVEESGLFKSREDVINAL